MHHGSKKIVRATWKIQLWFNYFDVMGWWISSSIFWTRINCLANIRRLQRHELQTYAYGRSKYLRPSDSRSVSVTFKVSGRILSMWSTYIMDLLVLLANFGQSVDPSSHAACMDFDQDGFISMYDFLQMLSGQPPITKSWWRILTITKSSRLLSQKILSSSTSMQVSDKMVYRESLQKQVKKR